MRVVVPTPADNAEGDILETSLPTTNPMEGERSVGVAGVVTTAETLASTTPAHIATETTIEMITIVMTTTTEREETGIPRTDEKNKVHQRAAVRVEADAAEGGGGEEGGEESSNNNNISIVNGHQHRPWIPGQPILPVGTPMRIPCG